MNGRCVDAMKQYIPHVKIEGGGNMRFPLIINGRAQQKLYLKYRGTLLIAYFLAITAICGCQSYRYESAPVDSTDSFPCHYCKGRGVYEPCSDCKGIGKIVIGSHEVYSVPVVTQYGTIGGGYSTVNDYGPCNKCNETGQKIDSVQRCIKCNGTGRIWEYYGNNKKIPEYPIKGLKHVPQEAYTQTPVTELGNVPKTVSMELNNTNSQDTYLQLDIQSPATTQRSTEDRLKNLKSLKEQELISEEDYEIKKNKILDAL